MPETPSDRKLNIALLREEIQTALQRVRASKDHPALERYEVGTQDFRYWRLPSRVNQLRLQSTYIRIHPGVRQALPTSERFDGDYIDVIRLREDGELVSIQDGGMQDGEPVLLHYVINPLDMTPRQVSQAIVGLRQL